mgnify:CR=1 FL=1
MSEQKEFPTVDAAWAIGSLAAAFGLAAGAYAPNVSLVEALIKLAGMTLLSTNSAACFKTVVGYCIEKQHSLQNGPTA